jgi:hypothetical protein
MAYDFDVYGGPSVFLLTPHTEAALDWAEFNLPDDAQMLGNGIAIEHRYLGDILLGLQLDGLTVARSY